MHELKTKKKVAKMNADQEQYVYHKTKQIICRKHH